MFFLLKHPKCVRIVLIGMVKGNSRNIDHHLMDFKGFLKNLHPMTL